MSIFNINQCLIKTIYTYNDKQDHYGLKVLFQLDNGYLFFDSSRFRFELDRSKVSLYQWEKLYYEHEGDLTIDFIKEDELVSYFVQFSNETIFYIYQVINGDEFWHQEFEVIEKNQKIDQYNEITAYMNEDWIEQSPVLVD